MKYFSRLSLTFFLSGVLVIIGYHLFNRGSLNLPQTKQDQILAASDQGTAQTLELTVEDQRRKRNLPILVYLPPTQTPAPVVLFSHGLGGSRYGSSYLGKHWAKQGYIAVFVQHPGSDRSVWKDEPARRRLPALQAAANGRNFRLRVQDIPAVLDQLERWNQGNNNALAGRMNLKQVGMSGHSFGAITTQAVSGQRFGRRKARFRDPRIEAAVILSPSLPRRGNPESAFAQVDIPWLLITGTQDVAMIGDADVDSRLAVFPALPPGEKYELANHGEAPRSTR